MRGLLLATAAFSACVLVWTSHSRGCAPAWEKDGPVVSIAAEEAIVFYDKYAKMQHFVRRSDFRTQSANFGFVVPTPSQPALGEIKSDVFASLDQATAARRVFSGKTITHTIRRPTPGEKSFAKKSEPKSAAPIIYEKTTVAGLDATVMLAKDVDGLKKWLEDHKYDARPALMTWLKKYVDDGWFLTAFKVSPNREPGSQWNLSVRMSFHADRPFYPYREPEDMRAGPAPSRLLRLYAIGDVRYSGAVGENRLWPGATKWANACPEHLFNALLDGCGLAEFERKRLLEHQWTLTEFADASSPRNGVDELYLSAAADQSNVERPVIYYDNHVTVYEGETPQAASEPSVPLWRTTLPLIAGGLLVVIALAALAYRYFR